MYIGIGIGIDIDIDIDIEIGSGIVERSGLDQLRYAAAEGCILLCEKVRGWFVLM